MKEERPLLKSWWCPCRWGKAVHPSSWVRYLYALRLKVISCLLCKSLKIHNTVEEKKQHSQNSVLSGRATSFCLPVDNFSFSYYSDSGIFKWETETAITEWLRNREWFPGNPQHGLCSVACLCVSLHKDSLMSLSDRIWGFWGKLCIMALKGRMEKNQYLLSFLHFINLHKKKWRREIFTYLPQ